MSVVKINAIEVEAGRGPELEARFARRANEVERMPGFEAFELLRPVEGETRYFVYTRWTDEASFRAWVESEAFTRGHTQSRGDAPRVAHGSTVLGFEVVQRVTAGAPAIADPA